MNPQPMRNSDVLVSLNRYRCRTAVLCLLFVLVVVQGCAQATPTANPPLPVTAAPVTPSPPASDVPDPATSATSTSSAIPPDDTGWRDAEPGVDVRRLDVPHPHGVSHVLVARLDPSAVRFRVDYAPTNPLLMAAWCTQPGVVAAINGGFFNQDYQSTALVISNGVASGTSYEGQGGMFAVDAQGSVSLRSLAEQPYHPDEPLVQAVQGWPMLLHPGGTLAYTNPDNGDRSRRSVLALDRAGRVLLLVVPTAP